MFLRISNLHLKSISLPPIIHSPRSALRLNSRLCRSVLASFPSRAAATKSSSQVLPLKPASNVLPHRLAPNAAGVRDARNNLLAQDLARSGSTLLFKARSHAGFMFAGWIGGVMCLFSTLVILNQKLYEKNKELPWIVPIGYRLSAIFLIGLGGWAIARSSRRISSIEVLPGNDKARLIINVRRNIPLPYIKPRRLNVLASDVTLHRRLVNFMGEPYQEDPSFRKPSGSFIRDITRSISTTIYIFFAGFRQFIFSDGMIYVYIEGYGGTWKLDGYGLFPEDTKPFYEFIRLED
jgi:hypothetical protein